MNQTTPTTNARPTLYSALGGRDAVAAAVDGLYSRLLADPATARFFVGMDMLRLNGHMRLFLTAALGDGATDRMVGGLGPAHAHLGITEDDFDRVAGHLDGALDDLGVEPGLIDRVLIVVGSLRSVVVTGR